MIVGNGLIANTLSAINHEKYLIFASGVSNSKEENPNAYKREIDLLLAQKRSNTLIYFSTCSIKDPTLSETAYIKHKIHIENLIKNEFPNYLIIRLPTLVGKTANPHTFFNFMKNKIINNEEVIVYKNAWRYLLDADDIKIIIPTLTQFPETQNTTINAAYKNALTVENIVIKMDKILKKTSTIKLLDEGNHFPIENDKLTAFLQKNNLTLFSDKYNDTIIRKYLIY